MSYIVSIILFFVMATGVFADKVSDMLAPSVRIVAGRATGSGTVVNTDPILGSFIVTNYHVVKGAKTISVTFYGDKKEYVGSLYSYDIALDIAVVLTRHVSKAVVTLGKASDMSIFDEAYCVGSSIGLPTAPSRGIITAVDFKPFKDKDVRMTRTDCGVAPGNSGGGLFVKRGDSYVYVGIPSIVMLVRVVNGFGASVVPFLGLAVRIQDIRTVLGYRNILK